MQFPFQIDPSKEFDCVGFGTNAVDFLIRVPHYPAFNSKVELSGYTRAAGGEIATTMAGLTRLGLKTAYVGRFGDDDPGEIGRRSLVDEGVDITFSESITDTRTQIAFIIIDERNGERTVIWERESNLAYSASDAPVEIATRCKVLHFTPHDTDACLEMAKAARSAGAIVSTDIDNVFDGIELLLPYIDILIASSDFPEKLTSIADRREALIEIHRKYGCAVTGVTLGEAGSLLYCEGEFIESKGFEVPGGCKDTTGAGDSFRVGLLYGLLTGQSVEESARAANAVAALKCRAVGARTSLPDAGELDMFLKKV
ncbi:MAG: carbohydrate kinase family protein [Acidobacteria bacterium]|nr:carbohydrate kinase family protein [Acidobacteriota bacterium]